MCGFAGFCTPSAGGGLGTCVCFEGWTGPMCEKGVGDDMYAFMQAFLAKHTELKKNPFHVFGESYAGHYVPNVAHAIWAGNQAGSNPKINLQGMSVGNGLTDPEVQYAYYPAMAISTNGHKAAVSNRTYTQMESDVQPCITAIKNCNGGGDKNVCGNAQRMCNNNMLGPYEQTGECRTLA